MKFALAAAALVAVNLAAAADLDPIVIKGTKFFYKTNGTQFFMKGVAYQAEATDSTSFFVDPLADENACKRDVPYLQELQTNTIRVYAIDPKKNHDACMKLLQDAGIYVISDLSEPKTSINRDDPQWDDVLYARYAAVVDSLASYSNVLGFFAGNEVSNQKNNTAASAYVKAAVRDTKAYIKQKKYRSIPVGYATNDDADIRVDLASYFNCNSQAEGIDFWGYNIYSWCGDSSYRESGYDIRTKEYENYSVPVFFAEYGCNQVQPRKFTDVEALYGDTMTKVWSGGIVYMYYQEANDYGLVKINGDKVTKLADFDYLKNQLTAVNPKGVQMASYTPTNTKLRACPAEGNDWRASAKLPPAPNQQLCSCMVDSLACSAKSNVELDKYADLFSYICGGGTDCTGIDGNGTTGEYGAYSMCRPSERLSWAMNAYYDAGNKAADACDFNGDASTKTPQSESSSCAPLLKEAGGAKGTGTVTSAPTITGTGNSGVSDTVISTIQVGSFKIGSAMVIAFLGGIAMVLV